MPQVFEVSFASLASALRRWRYSAYDFLLPRGTALRFERWEINRLYHRMIRDEKDADKLESLFNEAHYEDSRLAEDITLHYSNKLTNQARRLFVPVPYVVSAKDDPNWEPAKFSSLFYMKPNAIQTVRNAVREEQKARREAVAFWVTSIGGIIIGALGALTGLVAVLFE